MSLMILRIPEDYYKALVFAIKAHDGQYDKSGEPYVLHPLAVSESLLDEDEGNKVIALLHDVVEDTEYTLNDLRSSGFGCYVKTIDYLTRRENETYEDYIRRVCRNRTAVIIKIADMKHNLSRIESLPEGEKELCEEEKEQAERYRKWLPVLEDCLKNGNADKEDPIKTYIMACDTISGLFHPEAPYLHGLYEIREKAEEEIIGLYGKEIKEALDRFIQEENISNTHEMLEDEFDAYVEKFKKQMSI